MALDDIDLKGIRTTLKELGRQLEELRGHL
jgi:hypothetical protein